MKRLEGLRSTFATGPFCMTFSFAGDWTSPPPPGSLEQMRQQKSIHFSRNPLIVRVLADMGYLREMGEGVPRMFQEMEHHGLRPPEFSIEGFMFVVTLRNTPVYDEATLRWLNQF